MIKARWRIPRKIVENNRVRIPWRFLIYKDKEISTTGLDIIVIGKDQEIAVDMAISNGKSSRKKYRKLEKCQSLKEERNKI